MMLQRTISALLLAVALPATAGTWSTRTIAGMTVELYEPTAGGSYAAGRGLMVGLHGCTQQATALKTRGNWEPAAERFGVVIALPQVPNGGVIAGCWDYYGANHTRTTRHDGPLLRLVEALSDDAALGIDRAQVYISGLSSGAGQAAVIGCLAPEIFAGVGINAGPAVGTASSDIGRVATTKAAAKAACERLAGAASAGFETQLASIAYGTQDFIVHQGYGPLNAEVLAELYGASVRAPIDVAALPGFMPAGEGERFSDGRGVVRVERIALERMGHAFPAGSGDGFEMSFVASRGVAWPMVMLEQFTRNNRRASGPIALPPLEDAGAPAGDARARVDASASADAVGADGAGEVDAGSSADAAVAPGVTDGGCSAAGGAGRVALIVIGLVAGALRRRRR